MEIIEIKIFYAFKDIIKKVKTQPTWWEKTFINHIYNKRLVPRIYKKVLQLDNIKTNNPIKKLNVNR